MKKYTFIIISLIFLGQVACKSGKESGNEVIYEYEEEVAELNPELKSKIGDWVEEGAVCYGCVVSLDENKKPISGKSVKAKIIRIKTDGLKMKALENVSVGEGEHQGCTKLGISRGETWVETDGELFLTREEAEQFLSKMGL